jgi:hypothetical protein
LTVARLVNGFGPMHFSVFVHLNVRVVQVKASGVVAMPKDVMVSI